MAHVPLRPIGSGQRPPRDERSAGRLTELETTLRERRATVHAGWGPKYADRVAKKGKLTSRERIAQLVDPGTDVFEVGTFVNWGEEYGPKKLTSPGAGVVTCFARIEGRWCVVIANDNTVASGSWWPRGVRSRGSSSAWTSGPMQAPRRPGAVCAWH